MTPEIEAGLKEQMEEFRRKFGREPGPNDPVFFDPDAPEPRPWSEAAATAALVEAARKAGIDEALIYAMSKTGRIVSESNVKYLSPEELEEWQAAVEEYRDLQQRRN